MLAEMDEQELPALAGTPRQVAWATIIRARVLTAMDEQLRATEAHFAVHAADCEPAIDLYLARQRSVFASIRSHAQASYWIDRRTLSVAQMAYAEYSSMQARTSAAVMRERKRPLH
jgi:hypothetical protein